MCTWRKLSSQAYRITLSVALEDYHRYVFEKHWILVYLNLNISYPIYTLCPVLFVYRTNTCAHFITYFGYVCCYWLLLLPLLHPSKLWTKKICCKIFAFNVKAAAKIVHYLSRVMKYRLYVTQAYGTMVILSIYDI